jgi:hypothetical protein
MGISNKRLIDKLVKQSGGWETFLYQTLKDVVEEAIVINNPPGLDEALDEAKSVLEAYEERSKSVKEAIEKKVEFRLNTPSATEKLRVVEEAGKVVDESRTEAKLAPPESNGREEITRVTVLLPAKESKLQSQELRGVVSIDPIIGDCQGILPIPEGCRIVNRDKMRITTRTGAELGKPQIDGQVKESANVTGRIRTDGRFDLVFKDTKLGEAVIWYEVVEEGKPKEQELKMISFLDASSRKWVSFIEGSVVEARADTVKESRNQLLDALSKEHGMQIVSVAVLKRSEDNPEEIKPIPHILLQPGG